MNYFKNNYRRPAFALGVITLCALLFLLAALFFGVTRQAYGQAYGTNTNYTPGAAQYSSFWTPQINPAATLAAQQAAGILNGSIGPGQEGVGGLLVSNMFPTNIYTVPPSISISSSLLGTNSDIAVAAVTTTSFILSCGGGTNGTIYWTAIGH